MNISAFNRVMSPQFHLQQQEVRRNIREAANFDADYIIMNALATVVACYGLISNSAAVVIGAMLIAMLLGPISGIALALVDGDRVLLRKSLLAELGGVAIVLCIAMVIGTIHKSSPLTPEMLARTSPNILDLMIALAGGAAGAYATIAPHVRAGLVGVAIATALAPPLATCGICLAQSEHQLAFGGFLLFFANLVAIQFASSVVLWLHGYHKTTEHVQDGRSLVTRNAVSFILLLAITTTLGFNFSKSVAKRRFEADVRHAIETALKAYPGVHLVDLRFRRTGPTEIVIAVVDTPYSFVPKRVAAIEQQLPALSGSQVELHIRSVLVKETTRNGYLHQIRQKPGEGSADTSTEISQ